MARKSNKTSHVLHLLAGEEPVPETPENKDGEEGSVKAAEKEEAPAPQETPEQPRAEEELPNISIISTGNSEDDPVADLIKGQLEEDFPEDILDPQPTADADSDPAIGDIPTKDSRPDDAAKTTGDGDDPDRTDIPMDNDAADTADTSVVDDPTPDMPAESDSADMPDPSTDNTTPDAADIPMDSSSDETDISIDSGSSNAANLSMDDGSSDTADISMDDGSSDTAGPSADSKTPDTTDISMDHDSSDTADTTTADDNPDTTTGASVDNDHPAPSIQGPTETSEKVTDSAAGAAAETPPSKPLLTQEHLDSILYPVDGEHLQNYRFINVMEYIVKDIVIDYMKKFDMCTCERCVVDTIALTLTYCNAKYIVVDSHSVSPLLNFYSNRFLGDVTVELTKACIKIKDNPRH